MEPVTIEQLRKELKNKFHINFVSDIDSWKIKLEYTNKLLSTFDRIIPYKYDEFCKVCYYAISDVIDELVQVDDIEPSPIESFALKDSLETSGTYTEDKYREAIIRKRYDKFLSLQKRMSKSMDERMMEYLFNNKFPNKSFEEFKRGLDE